MTNITIRHLTRKEWDDLAPQFFDLSYRQCGSFAERAAETAHASSEFVAITEAEKLVGLSNVRIKRVPLSPLGIAYVHHGPLSRRQTGFSVESFGNCLDALEQEYVRRRHLILRVVPPTGGGHFLDVQAACLEERGFRRSKRQKALETFVLDLTLPLPDIRRNFDAKWRSDLVKSEKSNLRITKSTDLADFDRFEPLLQDLSREKSFTSARGTAFFRHVQAEAEAYEKTVVHLAWHDADLVAGHIGSFAGDTAVYLLGASTAKGRELRASYLLQWSVIEHATSNGNIYYDLGGIDQNENPNVYRFKKRLNGQHVREADPYEIAPSPLAERALQFVESAFGMLSRLRAGKGT